MSKDYSSVVVLHQQLLLSLSARKERRIKELNFIQDSYKLKLDDLKKRLLQRKQILSQFPFNPYKESEIISETQLIKSIVKPRRQQHEPLSKKKSRNQEHDPQLEKLMKRFESKFVLTKELPSYDLSEVENQRHKILKDILAGMKDHISKQESILFETRNKSIGNDHDYDEAKSKLYETKQKAKTLEIMIEKEQESLATSEFITDNHNRMSTQEQMRTQDDSLLVQSIDNDFQDRIKEEEARKQRIQEGVRNHMLKMGLLKKPKANDIKLPLIPIKKVLKRQQLVSRQTLITDRSQIRLEPLSGRNQSIKNTAVSQILDNCDETHKKLRYIRKKCSLRNRQKNKCFTAMETQLELVRESGFLDSKMILV